MRSEYNSFMSALKQSKESPLFEDLAWEKPERKDQAGKLLIIGGNLHGFSAVAKADETAKEQGIGYTRILLPDSLRRTLAPLWTDAVFCPSTSSGSFSKEARDQIFQNAQWADGILLAGDFGRNSETAMLIEEILFSLSLPIAITKDALDYYLQHPSTVLKRQNTFVVASFSQAQKILQTSKFSEALNFNMPIASLVGTLERFMKNEASTLITKMDNHIITVDKNNSVLTTIPGSPDIWRLEVATKAIVAVIHHPSKQFEAVCHCLLN